MTTFLVSALIVVALVIIGLLLNIYFYSHGVFRRRRRRIPSVPSEVDDEKRITTAELDEQYYSSLGIGPKLPKE